MSPSPTPDIAEDLCTSCHLCIDICPDAVIRADESGVARVMAEQCMGCGHCYAVCPAQAVEMSGLSTDLGLETIVLSDDAAYPQPIDIRSLLQLMQSRRSCRCFEIDPPDLEILKDLVRIGTTAPSGTNSQGWQFVILAQRSDVVALGEMVARFYQELNRKASNPLYRLAARLMYGNQLDNYYRNYYASIQSGLSHWYDNGVDRLFHGAPAVIVVAADNSSSCPQEDALLATQNMLLAAESLGLATCLIGFVVEAARRDGRITSALGLRKSESIYSVIGCGYAKVAFKRFPGRRIVSPRVVRLSEERTMGFGEGYE